MTTGGPPMNADSAPSTGAAAAAAARMASAGLSNAQAIQMQMNQQAGTSTQLQQRAAAAAQYLKSGQRKPTSRDVQTMLEKNDAALRAWTYLQAQQPPKHLIPEHKAWSHKCLALRQQIGARLEVLASLADKQVAHEDANTGQLSSSAKKPTTAARPNAVLKSTAPKPATSIMAQAQISQPQAQSQGLMQTSQAMAPTPGLMQPGRQNLPTATGSVSMMHQSAAPLGFPDPTQLMSTQALASGGAGPFYNTSSSNASTTALGFSSSSVAATSTSRTNSATAMPNASTSQAFNPQAYTTSGGGYMGGGMAQQQQAAQFMNQPNQVNFMMGNAMNVHATNMMNPQFMGMQGAGGQMPMGMSSGAMYNPAMFNSAGYMGMSTNQLPTDPFNASFQMQPTSNFNDPYSMAGNQQMMGSMGGFVPMQNTQMMMNPMAFNMGMNQQQFQQSQLPQATGFTNPGPSQQPQQPQQQQQQSQQGPAATQPTLPSPPLLPSFSDDDSNIFDGLGDDAFLNME